MCAREREKNNNPLKLNVWRYGSEAEPIKKMESPEYNDELWRVVQDIKYDAHLSFSSFKGGRKKRHWNLMHGGRIMEGFIIRPTTLTHKF